MSTLPALIKSATSGSVFALSDLRQALASELGMPLRQVRVWGPVPGEQTVRNADVALRIEILPPPDSTEV